MSSEAGFTFSRRDRRQLSPFLAQELLYDYLTGRLDGERKLSVERHLESSRESQQDLAKLVAGLRYVEKLSSSRVHLDIIDEINEPETYLSIVLKKTGFEHWPLTVKWGLEAAVVISVLILALVIIPWDKALRMTLSPAGKDIVLAEIDRTRTHETSNLNEAEKKEPGAYEDESVVVPPVAAAPVVIPSIQLDAKTPSETSALPSAPAKLVAKSGAAESSEKKSGEGFLHKGQITVVNLPVVAPLITQRIQELGGRKAGEVELGWKKTQKSYYYHFTIPEAKYEELRLFFEGYGKLKISKDKHPRVMPEGIMRLIVTVDEAAP